MSDVALLVTETHRTNESLVLDWATCEIWSDEGWLGDHALPSLLRSLLSGLDNLEHLILSDTADLWQRNAELRSLLISLVLNSGGQSLSVRWVGTVEEILRKWCGRWLGWGGRLDVALLVGLDLLLHLDLLVVTLLLVELGAETSELLCVLGLLVALTGGALALALLVVEAAAVELAPSLHILILRL